MEPDETREPVAKEVRLLVPIEKGEAPAKRISYGVVLEPDTEDLQGDVMTAEDIETAAYDWMERSQAGGHMHTSPVEGAKVVESYIAPCDIPVETAEGRETIRKGSWVLAMRWPEEIWESIAKGDLTGYSVGGTGVRTSLEEIGKKGKWAPGPNAGWRRADGEVDPATRGAAAQGGGTPADRGAAAAAEDDRRRSRENDKARPKTYHSDEAGEVTVPEDDDSSARPEDEERDEELRRSRARSTKPNKSAEDTYAAETLRSFDLVDGIEERLQNLPAPSDDFEPNWEHAGTAEETDNKLGAVLGFLSGDEDAYAQAQGEAANFKTAEEAYSAHMVSAFDRAEQIRELLQDQRAPGDDFTPNWGHAGDAQEISRRLAEVQSFLGGGEVDTSRVDTSPKGTTHFFSAKPKPGFKEPMRPTGNTYFWSQKRADPDPWSEAIGKAVREALEEVAKKGKWTPGPNAGWRLANGNPARDGSAAEGGRTPADRGAAAAREDDRRRKGDPSDEAYSTPEERSRRKEYHDRAQEIAADWEDLPNATDAEILAWADQTSAETGVPKELLRDAAADRQWTLEEESDALDGYPSGTVDDEERYPTGGKWAGEDDGEDDAPIAARKVKVRGLTHERVPNKYASFASPKDPEGSAFCSGPGAGWSGGDKMRSTNQLEDFKPGLRVAGRVADRATCPFKDGEFEDYDQWMTGTVVGSPKLGGHSLPYVSVKWDKWEDDADVSGTAPYGLWIKTDEAQKHADPGQKSLTDVVREALVDVAKDKGWAPGPNAGWRRASGETKRTPREESWERHLTAPTPEERRRAGEDYVRYADAEDAAMVEAGGGKHPTRDGVEDQPKVQRIKNSEMFASADGRVQLDYGEWKWTGSGKEPKLYERGHWGVWPRGADRSDVSNIVWSDNQTLAEFINSLPPGEYKLAT